MIAEFIQKILVENLFKLQKNSKRYDVFWADKAKDDLKFWKGGQKSYVSRIKKLINNIREEPYSGIGKPERLKYSQKKNLWSRRIDNKHRIIYSINENIVTIESCKGHYGDH